MTDLVRGERTAPGEPLAILSRLNLVIAVVSAAVAIACLWIASHAPHWTLAFGAAFVFSFANNTNFSLLHECVHGSFHENRRVNDGAGVLFAAFFPTAFTIQRISHFGHHRRNRSDLELYDYYLPQQSRWLKTYWIYCLLTGFYWAIIPVSGIVYVLCPSAFRSRVFQNGPAKWWGFQEFVRDISAEPIARVWPEALSTLVFQVSLWRALDLHWIGWLACYWAFGLNWSSLQYTDHAWSPRDVREGAWNSAFLADLPGDLPKLQLPPCAPPPAHHPVDPAAAFRADRRPQSFVLVDLCVVMGRGAGGARAERP